MVRRLGFKILAALLFLCPCFSIHSQAARSAERAQASLSLGLEAFSRLDLDTAIPYFRQAAAESPSSAEPFFWLIAAEISAGNFEAAFSDIDNFLLDFKDDRRAADVLYQKGRLEFLASRYDEAIQTLGSFVAANPSHRLAPSAYYWIAETLFATARFKEAASVYAFLIEFWPQSVKHEAAAYRLALIEQKSTEEELLALLQASHEESLRSAEDYQRRERTYEQAIASYQRRISDMMKDTRLEELESSLTEERLKNSALEDEISLLEAQNEDLISALIVAGVPVPQSARTERTTELEAANAQARNRALEELIKKAVRAREIYERETEMQR